MPKWADEHRRNVEVKSTHNIVRKPGALEVVSGLAHERRTAGGLDEPDDASDLGPAEVDALEAVKEADTDAGCLLELVGVVHHRDLFLRALLGETVGETKDGPLGVLEAALSGQPPWTTLVLAR